MRLSRTTGDERYFRLAQFFLEHRGEHFFATEHATPAAGYDGSYWLDDVRIREHQRDLGPRRARALPLLRRARRRRRDRGRGPARRRRPGLGERRRQAHVRDRRARLLVPQRGLHGRLRPADVRRLPGDLRLDRVRDAQPAARAAERRLALRGPRGVVALQRCRRRGLALRRPLLLRQPARVPRRPPPQALVRLCLLPAERRAHAREPRPVRLRDRAAGRVRQPLRRGQRGSRRGPGSAPAGGRVAVPVGRPRRADGARVECRVRSRCGCASPAGAARARRCG